MWVLLGFTRGEELSNLMATLVAGEVEEEEEEEEAEAEDGGM